MANEAINVDQKVIDSDNDPRGRYYLEKNLQNMKYEEVQKYLHELIPSNVAG